MTAKKDSRNRGFEEKAHLNVDQDAYGEGWDRIFGKKKDTEIDTKKFIVGNYCTPVIGNFKGAKCELLSIDYNKTSDKTYYKIRLPNNNGDGYYEVNELVIWNDKEIERVHQMAIKDKARHSFRNLDTDNGSEGFPEGSSYIYGFMQGYNEALKENK